jgi:hypothetical protein
MAEQPPFRPGQSYNSPLDPLTEMQFRSWVKQNGVPFNPDAAGPSDYDMRGYFLGQQRGQPMAQPSEVNPNDNRPHYTDYYKTPMHQTFSAESQWAGPGAPQWINDHQLAAPSGRIMHDEASQPSALARLLMMR